MDEMIILELPITEKGFKLMNDKFKEGYELLKMECYGAELIIVVRKKIGR